eukprot:c5854_g1_i1 orf=66-302(+)
MIKSNVTTYERKDFKAQLLRTSNVHLRISTTKGPRAHNMIKTIRQQTSIPRTSSKVRTDLCMWMSLLTALNTLYAFAG